jgi:hypothetical protein
LDQFCRQSLIVEVHPLRLMLGTALPGVLMVTLPSVWQFDG